MRALFSVAWVSVSVACALVSGLEVYAAPPPIPPVLEGSAIAVDGDTLDLVTSSGTHRVRLQAIDAAEGGQRCNLKWIGTWDCGRAATIALQQLIQGQRVSCRTEGQDRHGRVLGVCHAGGRDVNAELVRAGLAWAYVHYSDRYSPDEQIAREMRLGIWQGRTMPPWEWRQRQRLAQAVPVPLRSPAASARAEETSTNNLASDLPPRGCDIKGNVTAQGRIYHTRESPWYERVRMSLGAGRRWFCSEDEARTAGWRAAGERVSQRAP